MAAEVKSYIVVHRDLGALCGLARVGFYWQRNWPRRTPVVFSARQSAEACRQAVNQVYCAEVCEVQEYQTGSKRRSYAYDSGAVGVE